MKKSSTPTPSARSAKSGASTVKFDQGKDVRAIARERVGTVKPAQIIPSKVSKDKKQRKKPKHKLPAGSETEAE
jgi:hypothetical protein